MSSVTRDMDVERCGKFVKKNGHAALSFTPMDMNLARELNRRLYDFVGKEDIVMDLTTAALGYGLDYAFTNMERARIGRLNGRHRTRSPNVVRHYKRVGSTRSMAQDGTRMGTPRATRTSLGSHNRTTLLLAGVDLFMMMHPAAVKTLKDVTKNLVAGGKVDPQNSPTGFTSKLKEMALV